MKTLKTISLTALLLVIMLAMVVQGDTPGAVKILLFIALFYAIYLWGNYTNWAELLISKIEKL